MIRHSKVVLAAAVLAAGLLARPAIAAAQFTAPITRNAVVVDSAGPAAPELAQPERLHGLVRREYPSLLRAAGIMGEARVRVSVSEAGRVVRVTEISDSHDAFADPARRIARQVHFRPVAEGGAAGDVILRITFHPVG